MVKGWKVLLKANGTKKQASIIILKSEKCISNQTQEEEIRTGISYSLKEK